MKILLFTDNLGAGGAQRQLVGLAVMLKNKGYSSKVCCYQDNSFYYGYLKENGVPYEVIPNSNDHKKRIFSVTRYFKEERPDWVIAFQETPSLVACIARLMLGKYKLLVSERNTTQELTIKDKIRFFLYKFANVIVPNSFSQGEFIAKYYPNLSTKINVITNFVDLKKFAQGKKKRKEIPLVMIAASVWSPKNTLNFIKAVSILKEKCIRVKFDWYGIVEPKTEANKVYQQNCTNLINELNVTDMLSLLPKTQQISEKYLEADYFCLPSFYEGTPNVICEAMACGCPIICSDVCDNAHYVYEDDNGYLFDPNSPEDMANVIIKALTVSDEKYELFCNKSRKIAEEKLSEEKFINSYIKILT